MTKVLELGGRSVPFPFPKHAAAYAIHPVSETQIRIYVFFKTAKEGSMLQAVQRARKEMPSFNWESVHSNPSLQWYDGGRDEKNYVADFTLQNTGRGWALTDAAQYPTFAASIQATSTGEEPILDNGWGSTAEKVLHDLDQMRMKLIKRSETAKQT